MSLTALASRSSPFINTRTVEGFWDDDEGREVLENAAE
jgi:hypothetical protein